MKDKALIEEKSRVLDEMTGKFCDEHLNNEYNQLCEKPIQKMTRKRNAPFLYGGMEIWAAAIIHSLGSINFLFDKSFKPYASAEDISAYFGASKSAVSQKAKVIRDMFRLQYWDDEFSTEYMRKNNPFANLTMINGFIVDKRNLPKEITKEKKVGSG